MPKGVEHLSRAMRFSNEARSVESLMPKGVEHYEKGEFKTYSTSVESLMPKGVEHRVLQKNLPLLHTVSNL